MTTTDAQPTSAAGARPNWPPQPKSYGYPYSGQRTPLSSSTKFSDAQPVDAEVALQEEIEDQRLIDLRADVAGQFVEDLELSTQGTEGFYIPGKRVISRAAAAGLSASAFDDSDDPFGDMPDDEPQPPTGAVIGSTVATFMDGLTGQQKDDVENAILLSQLAADAKYTAGDQPVEWFNYFYTVLRRTGWILESGRWSRLNTQRVSFTVDEVILSVIRSLLSPNQLGLAEAALEAMKSLSDTDRRIVIWERSSLDGPRDGAVNFDLVAVSPAGNVSLQAGAYAFGTKTNVERFLWFSFPSNQTTFAASRSKLVLNQQVYDRVRDAIINKLGSAAASFVGTLPDFSAQIPG